MIKVLFATLLLVGLASAGDVIFTECATAPSNPTAEILTFSVSDCPDGSNHCTFVKGRTYNFNVTVKLTGLDSAGDSGFIPFKVVAVVLVPITIAEGNACETIECPVKRDETKVFSLSKEITDSLPALNDVVVAARIWASDEPGTFPQAAACAAIRISIVNAVDEDEKHLLN